MNIIWGILMALIGLFFLISAYRESDFIVYRLLAARAQLLWGDRVHLFFKVVGLILILFGLLWAFGLIWTTP